MKNKSYIDEDQYSILRFLYKNPGIIIPACTLVVTITSFIINHCYSLALHNYYKFWGYNLRDFEISYNYSVKHFFFIFSYCFVLQVLYLFFFPQVKNTMNVKVMINRALKDLKESSVPRSGEC